MLFKALKQGRGVRVGVESWMRKFLGVQIKVDCWFLYNWNIECKLPNPLTTNVPHHIETSQLICNANQLTGFYMMGNIGC